MAASTPSSADCSGTCRWRATRGLVEGRGQSVVQVARLQRRQPQPRQARQRRQRATRSGRRELAVAPRAQVDAAQHHLAAAAGQAGASEGEHVAERRAARPGLARGARRSSVHAPSQPSCTLRTRRVRRAGCASCAPGGASSAVACPRPGPRRSAQRSLVDDLDAGPVELLRGERRGAPGDHHPLPVAGQTAHELSRLASRPRA